MILVILGGSSSGKTDFALHCNKYGFPKVITNTTRQKRVDDLDNAYHFLTKEEFFDKVSSGKMLEYAEYNNNFYGTDIDSFSKNCVVVLEPNGFREITKKLSGRVFSILLDVSDSERECRAILRGDNIDTIKERIKGDKLLFTEGLKTEVDLILCDLKREDYDEVLLNNLDIMFSE